MGSELAFLIVGLVVVLFVGKAVGKILFSGGCGALMAALITLAIIAIGAMNFAHVKPF